MEVPCLKCGKKSRYEGNPFRPFCCERCKLLDLYGWTEGEYVIPGKGQGEDDESPEAEES